MRLITELMDLSGRTALIAGGAGHIGSAMAEAMAELGASIVILDQSMERSAALCNKLMKDFGIDAYAYSADLAQDGSVREVVNSVVAQTGKLDIVVYAAALVNAVELGGWSVPFEEQDSGLWPRALQVNLTSAFTLIHSAAPHLKKTGHGSVINLISHYGLVGPDWSFYEGTEMGNAAGYAASKGGLLQLTRWLSTTLAPKVRVNAITPGGVFRGHTDPFLSRYVERTPMNRMGKEEDFKGAVAYLASDLSAYVTGQNIVVDGGITAL